MGSTAERMHELLMSRGPMRTGDIAAALGVTPSTVSNAGRELKGAGRIQQDRMGGPWRAVPSTPEQQATRAAWAATAASVAPPAPAAPPKEEPTPAEEPARADLARISEEAAAFAPGPFGLLLWVDARCIAHGMPALSPWWRFSTGSLYESGKRWGIFCVGRGGGKSSSLERVAAAECYLAPRTVFPGQAWIWPFISVSVPDATRRLRGISAVYRAIGLPFVGEYARGEKVKEGVRTSFASPAHIEMKDARGNEIQLISIAGTVGNVSGPSAIGGTIDEAAKLYDKAENANPLREIFVSFTQMFRARQGPRAIMCSSALAREGMHFDLVKQGDTETNFVARIGAPYIDDARRGFEQVAAWEQARGDARAAAQIRTHAAALTADSPLVPTWIANPTLGHPDAQPWDGAALASRREIEAIPEGSDKLEGLPRWALWLRECGSVPMDRSAGFDARAQLIGLAEANARLARRQYVPGAVPIRSHPNAPIGDPRHPAFGASSGVRRGPRLF